MKLKDWIDLNTANVTTLARKLKRSRQMIYNYCDEKSKPSLVTAYQIEQITDGKVTMYDWVRPVQTISIDNI